MRTVLAGGEIFDAHSGVFESGDVAFEDGVIVEIGAGLDGDDVIDAGGHQILPGLIDSHVHVMISHLDLYQHAHTPYSYRFYDAIGNLSNTVRAGVTTVRDAGGADLGVKQAVADGLVLGPHLHIAIGMISQTGGHGDSWLPSGQHLRLLSGGHPGAPRTVVDGPEEVRRIVRELIRAGADVLKVATSGGVLSPGDDPKHAHFQPDELAMLVAEAKSAGLWVMAHAQASDGIKNAIRAGVRSIEHGIYLDEEAIGMMLEHGTFLVPTLIAPTGVIEAAEAGAMVNPASVAKAKEVVEVHNESFAMAVEAGVRVAMGTDTGVTPHGDNLKELPLMVAGGMSPTQALTSATATAAELLGIEGIAGSIEVGKRADLVLVSGDATDLVALPNNIVGVWKAGARAF